jgi:iron complex outermembrane receptor protein
VPNLNWASGGSSRPRYFQLRGIGELDQYQGAPNPSVGFLDRRHRPERQSACRRRCSTSRRSRCCAARKGTRYGANALAGLIKRQDARRESHGRAGLAVDWRANYETRSVGAVAAVRSASGLRLAARRAALSSDGFLRDACLRRDDTNGFDETTVRGKLSLELPAGWRVDLAALWIDLDNGYDAFSLDNSRRTLSDKPGRDAQRTQGLSAVFDGPLGDLRLSSTTAHAASDSVYSFDGDWASDAYWDAYAPYDYFSNFQRQRSTLTEDLRLGSGTGSAVDWVAGAYALRLEEDSLQRDYFAAALLRAPLETQYAATSLAAYGEAEWRLSATTSLTAGLRVETRSADYRDSDGARFDPRDTMFGGQMSIEGAAGASAHWYATVARGYKAGGFNIGAAVPVNRRQFEPEYLWNAEAGLRFADGASRLQGELSVFHMWREEQQVSTSFQLDPGDPLSYVFFTDNAARGRNYGLEASGSLRVAPRFTLDATLGLLHSEYLGYQYGDRDLDGREQAHAPSWQYSVSAQWGGEQGWLLRADLVGVDAFYFDASHDQRSSSYALLNLKAGYTRGAWSASAWARNLTDEDYAVRGFYFGLEPPDFANELYVQRGDGRLVGVTLAWRWK